MFLCASYVALQETSLGSPAWPNAPANQTTDDHPCLDVVLPFTQSNTRTGTNNNTVLLSGKWNDYRIGDGVALRPDAPGCDQYPDSIVCAYQKYSSEPNNITALLRVLDAYRTQQSTMSANAIVVHVRLGDGLCAQFDQLCRGDKTHTPNCWEDDSDCWFDPQSSTKQYAFSERWYENVMLDLSTYRGQRAVFILGDKHHWTRTPDPRKDYSVDDAYLENVKIFFRSLFQCVHILEAGDPDEDFALMCSARTFVQGGGGYSALIAQVIEARGGTVFKPNQGTHT